MFRQETQKTRNLIVSVTEVRPASDLSYVKVFLSIFPQEKAEDTLKSIIHNSGSLRYELGKRMGGILRTIPELTFVEDRSQDYLEKIDQLLAR